MVGRRETKTREDERQHGVEKEINEELREIMMMLVCEKNNR